jgi:hypothetical protein
MDAGDGDFLLAGIDQRLFRVLGRLRVMGRCMKVAPRVALVVIGAGTDIGLDGVETLGRYGPHVARRHAALPDDLIEGDPGHHGDIERSHLAEEWERDHVVATLSHETADPLPFSAQNDRHRTLVVDGVPSLPPFGIEPDHPESPSLERLDGLGDVSDSGDLHVLERPCRGPRYGFREPGVVSVWKQHAVGARGLGGAQDSAEVPRILYAVENDDESGVVRPLQKVLHGHDRLRRDHGDDALVGQPSSHPVEGLPRFEAQRDTHLGRAGDSVGDSLVPEPLDDEKAIEMSCPGAQRFQDWVDAADEIHGKKILVSLVVLQWSGRSRTVA